MCSINLQHAQVRETGRYFSGSYLDPFLCIGVKLANFQSSGLAVLVLRETLNMLQRTGAIWLLNSLRIRGCRLSGPGALALNF